MRDDLCPKKVNCPLKDYFSKNPVELKWEQSIRQIFSFLGFSIYYWSHTLYYKYRYENSDY